MQQQVSENDISPPMKFWKTASSGIKVRVFSVVKILICLLHCCFCVAGIILYFGKNGIMSKCEWSTSTVEVNEGNRWASLTTLKSIYHVAEIPCSSFVLMLHYFFCCVFFARTILFVFGHEMHFEQENEVKMKQEISFLSLQ